MQALCWLARHWLLSLRVHDSLVRGFLEKPHLGWRKTRWNKGIAHGAFTEKNLVLLSFLPVLCQGRTPDDSLMVNEHIAGGRRQAPQKTCRILRKAAAHGEQANRFGRLGRRRAVNRNTAFRADQQEQRE